MMNFSKPRYDFSVILYHFFISARFSLLVWTRLKFFEIWNIRLLEQAITYKMAQTATLYDVWFAHISDQKFV